MELRPGAVILLACVLFPQSSSSQCADTGVCSIGHRPSGDRTLEALAIKQLGESSVLTSSAALGSPALSEGLTHSAFVAIPTLKREVNVDGLKRSIALSAGLSVSL